MLTVAWLGKAASVEWSQIVETFPGDSQAAASSQQLSGSSTHLLFLLFPLFLDSAGPIRSQARSKASARET